MKQLWTMLTGNHFSVAQIMSSFVKIEKQLQTHAANKADERDIYAAKAARFETLSAAAHDEVSKAARAAEKIRTFLQ